MYAKIHRALWDGTLAGSWQGWTVFVFLLAHCDSEGVVDMTPRAIAARSGLPLADVETGLAALEAPDPESRSDGYEGRRIVRLDENRSWGWWIVNRNKWRDLKDTEEIRAQSRERVRRWRERNGNVPKRSVTPGNAPLRQTETEGEREKITPRPSAAALRTSAAGEPDSSQQDLSQTPGGRPGARKAEDGSEVPAPAAAVSGDPAQPVELSIEIAPMFADVVPLPLRVEGKFWTPLAVDFESWSQAYAGVDLMHEWRKMLAWLDAKPRRRKTARGMPAFVQSWLRGAESEPGRRTGARRASDEAYVAANLRSLQGVS